MVAALILGEMLLGGLLLGMGLWQGSPWLMSVGAALMLAALFQALQGVGPSTSGPAQPSRTTGTTAEDHRRQAPADPLAAPGAERPRSVTDLEEDNDEKQAASTHSGRKG